MQGQKTPDSFRLLDAAEASAAMRISKSTLYRLVKQGKLHRSSVSFGRALFSLAEVQRIISTPLGMQGAA